MPRQIITNNKPSNYENEGVEGQNNKENDKYLDVIVKLIPVEIISAYLTLVNILKGVKHDFNFYLNIIFLVSLMILTYLYLKYIGKVNSQKQLIVSTIGFLIWALAIYAPIEDIYGYPISLFMSVVVVFFTLLLPLLFLNEPRTQLPS